MEVIDHVRFTHTNMISVCKIVTPQANHWPSALILSIKSRHMFQNV